jgi:hypothetical protein
MSVSHENVSVEFCSLRHSQTVNHAYYGETAVRLQKAEQVERPEFWFNNCTSNTTMLQHPTMSVTHFQVRHPHCVA